MISLLILTCYSSFRKFKQYIKQKDSLVRSARNYGGEPSNPQQEPVTYFASALIKHRQAGRGNESEDHRTKSGQAITALQLYI